MLSYNNTFTINKLIAIILLCSTYINAQTICDSISYNIGSGQEVSIRDLADQVRGVVGFTGELEWDSSKPDGTPRKWVDVERLDALGWSATTTLAEGLGLAYQDFLERYHQST